MQERNDPAEIIRLATGDPAADGADALELVDDTEWTELVKTARTRVRTGFDKAEISAKDAVAILLADLRLREKTRGPQDDPLEGLRDDVANVLGVRRDHATIKRGEIIARKSRRR